MAQRAGVVGASGYAGAELLRLLARHPDLEVVAATAGGHAGARVGELYPSLGAAYPDLVLEALDVRALDGLDVAFLALPHGESQQLAPDLLGRVAHVVDLGADFRLPAADYERWYGAAHAAPGLLGRFSCGLPELFRARIGTDSVAVPGCYPTAAALAVAPLLADRLVDASRVVVDAMSGVSGRGRGLSTASLFAEANETVTPYALLTHRHTGEIEHLLGAVHDAPVSVLFTPHLVPMTRGLLATCTAPAARSGLTTASLLDRYRAFYADEPFVAVLDEPPTTKATLGSNAAQLTVRYDDRTGTVLALGALDNLVKGAAGQALQAANLVLGLPEPTGLSTLGIMP